MVEGGRKRFPIAALLWGLASTPFWGLYFLRQGFSLRAVIAATVFAVAVMLLTLTLAWRKANGDARRR
jgi:hypothetical protein